MTPDPPAVRRTHLRAARLLSLLAAALVATFALAAPAHAARPHLVKPRSEALVVGPQGKLHIEVKVRGHNAGGARPQAEVDGHAVAARFHRSGKADWNAALSIGRLPRGEHNLAVTTGKQGDGSDSVRFFVARSAPSSVDFSWHTGWRKRPTHLLAVRSRREIARIAGYPKVFLNGRRIDHHLTFGPGGHRFGGGVGPDAGLRYGRNKVRVAVLLKNGDYASAHRTFKVSRDRPLAGAGPDRRTSVGRGVVLDGTSSRLSAPLAAALPLMPVPQATASTASPSVASGPAPEPIEYQWKVLSAPPGTPAKLEEPEGEETIFVPEIPGTYVIEELVKPDGGGPAAVDYVTVHAPPSNEPMGIPIQTITDSGAIQVGPKAFARQAAGVKMLVLSASTLHERAGAWGPAVQTFQPQGNGEWKSPNGSLPLKTSIEKAGNGQVVVLSGQGAPISGSPLSSSQASNLEKAIVEIGGTLVKNGQTPNGATDLINGHWSVIGYEGLTEGHAREDIGIAQAPLPAGYAAQEPGFPTDAGSAGSLNGFMQRIGSATYQYVSPEFLALNTKWTTSPAEPPSPTQNTIEVGKNRYQSGTIPDGAIAMQVLVLDGSEPTKVLENSTYTVLNPDCATNFGGGGIYSLDEALHRWAAESEPAQGAAPETPTDSNIVIVQDFGHQTGGCWPGGNDTDWLQDALPSISRDGSGWNGSTFPTKRSQLLSMWNKANVHGFGSVAGNFGAFAGTAAHDAVANYRRPFYDSETGTKVNRDYGGLTLVTSTNLFQRSSSFFQGQGESAIAAENAAAPDGDPTIDNGTVTGVLRRNEQSQWELSAGSSLAGSATEKNQKLSFEQAGLFEVMFRPPTAWPCSVEHPAPCQGTEAELEAVQSYFLHRLSPRPSVTDLRELYPLFFQTNFNEQAVLGPYPSPREQIEIGGGEFKKALYETMQHGVADSPWEGVAGEVAGVTQVNSGIQQWKDFFESGKYFVDINSVGEQVVNEVNRVYDKLKKQDKEEEMNGSIAASALYLLSDLIEIGVAASGNPEAIPVVAPSVGALASMIDVGDDAAEVYNIYGPHPKEIGEVPNNTEAIRAKVNSLADQSATEYAIVAETMEHFGSILVSDPEKLREAGIDFDPAGPWSMSVETREQTQRAMGYAVQRAAFETTLPMAFVQWVTSPRFTNRNPGGSGELAEPALQYQCVDTNSGHGADTRDPWPKALSTAWSMEQVGWSGGGPTAGTNMTPQNSQNYTIRGLKSSLDDMHPGRADPETGLQHSGSMASTSLMEKVFRQPPEGAQPTAFQGAGLSKEEIFGLEDWTTRKFGCGTAN